MVVQASGVNRFEVDLLQSPSEVSHSPVGTLHDLTGLPDLMVALVALRPNDPDWGCKPV